MTLEEFLKIEAKLRKEHPELNNRQIEFILELVLQGADKQDLKKEKENEEDEEKKL